MLANKEGAYVANVIGLSFNIEILKYLLHGYGVWTEGYGIELGLKLNMATV